MTWQPWSDLTAAERREIAAMNARTYAMPEEDSQRWFSEHPLEMFEGDDDVA